MTAIAVTVAVVAAIAIDNKELQLRNRNLVITMRKAIAIVATKVLFV